MFSLDGIGRTIEEPAQPLPQTWRGDAPGLIEVAK